MLYTYLLIYKVYFTTWEDADLESEWSSYKLEQIIDVLLWHYSTCLAQHNVLRMHVRIYVPASICNIYISHTSAVHTYIHALQETSGLCFNAVQTYHQNDHDCEPCPTAQ